MYVPHDLDVMPCGIQFSCGCKLIGKRFEALAVFCADGRCHRFDFCLCSAIIIKFRELPVFILIHWENVFIQREGSLNDVLRITRLAELAHLFQRLLDEGDFVINDLLAIRADFR